MTKKKMLFVRKNPQIKNKISNHVNKGHFNLLV